MKREEPWIGFAHVQPKGDANPLGKGLKGAFVHVLALAANAQGYKSRARQALEEQGFFVVEIKDVAPVAQYRNEDRISQEMDDLIEGLSPMYPVQFDTFDAYKEHNA